MAWCDPFTGRPLALLALAAAAGVLIAEHADRMGTRLTFADHARAGIPIALLSLAFATFWLWLIGVLPLLPTTPPPTP